MIHTTGTIDAPASASLQRTDGRMSLLIACSVVVLLILVVYAPIVLPGPWQRSFFVASDLTRQFYPFQHYGASRLVSGQLPLWDPYIFGGQPHLADPQTAVFSPTGLLINLLAGHGGLPFVALEWRVVLDVALGALFMLLLVRQLTRSTLGGIVGAVTFSLGGYLTSYPVLQLPVLEASIWLPAVLLCSEMLLEEPAKGQRSWLWAALGGLAAASLVFAGHEQTTLYALIGAGCFACARWMQLRRAVVPTLLQFGALALMGLAISTPQWLSTLTYLPVTNRVALPYAQAASGFRWQDLTQVLVPGGYFVRSLYVGIPSLLLAIFALRKRSRWWWAGLALGAMILSLGGHGPLYPVLYKLVPPFSLFQDQERAAFLTSIALSTLAGAGAADLWNARRREIGHQRSSQRIAALVSGGLALMFVVAAALLLRATAPAGSDFAATAPRLVGVGGLVLLLASSVAAGFCIVRGYQRPWLTVTLLVALPTLNLLGANGALGRTSVDPIQPLPGRAVAFLHEQTGPFRVDELRFGELPANDGAIADLSFPEGNDPLYVTRAARLARFTDRYQVWQLFGVRYVLTRQDPGRGFELVQRDGSFKLFRMDYPLPMAYAVRQLIVAANPAEARRLTEHLEHPGAAAVVEQAIPLSITGPQLPRNQHEDWVSKGPEHLEIRAMVTDNAFLVISEPLVPGWSARVDGHAVLLYRADYVFMGVPLRAGEHLVSLTYAPPHFHIALLIAAAALVLCAGTALVAAARGVTRAR
ncbi:MAG: YfhO family protein [Chloroflexi bacterium]|nr:YfhO family protein [Chloroflexota bacterium]